LIEQLQRLPGVGPKSAQRLALHILKRSQSEVEQLAQALIDAKQQVGLCQVCFHLSAEPTCDICRHPQRDNSTICVVADSRDVIALERTREFNGKYHVLGGTISPMDGIGPEQLNISALIRRIDALQVKEVIIAISPTVEGETTTQTFYQSYPNRLWIANGWRSRICRRNNPRPRTRRQTRVGLTGVIARTHPSAMQWVPHTKK
jgi:recombination protein RecR